MCLFEHSVEFLGNRGSLGILSKLSVIPLVGRVFLGTLSRKIYFHYEFIVTMLSCLEHINLELTNMIRFLDYRPQLELLRQELHSNQAHFTLALDTIKEVFPLMIGFVKTKRASYQLLEF